MPGRVWAPAWVAWRAGGDYVGWAPLPPEAIWQPDRGIVFPANFSVERLSPQRWVFVRKAIPGRPEIHRHVVVEPRNLSLISVTNNTTNFIYVNNRIVNRSVDVRRIERVRARHPARPRRNSQQRQRRAARGAGPRAIPSSVFQPRVAARPGGAELAPPPQIIERSRQDSQRQVARQRERLQQREQLIRERLESEQAEELKNAGNAKEVRQRQEQERRALERMNQRQHQALERQARLPATEQQAPHGRRSNPSRAPRTRRHRREPLPMRHRSRLLREERPRVNGPSAI